MNSTFHYTHLQYSETDRFSKLVTDYLDGAENLTPFYNFSPNASGIKAAIDERCKHPVNRAALVAALQKQYESLPPSIATNHNISRLIDENTFTVCTAHQPNLLTGYLYFVYKIIHAIKLAESLCQTYPDKHFVPVYYMGSEDNDIAELGTFKFRGERYKWDGNGQSGAVGHMSTTGLKPLIHKLVHQFGPPGNNCDELTDMIITAYTSHQGIASATQYLVHALFGRFGLVVLNPDDRELKRLYIPVMRDELLTQRVYTILSEQTAQLGQHYKTQAFPRPINLFYLKPGLRERIEHKDGRWMVLNTAICWTQEELLHELQTFPERFSPNVMLRGMYQETILPDVAFIGGGAEVAYWMQLSGMFRHYNVCFPCVLLRQSVLWVNKSNTALMAKTGIGIHGLFRKTEDLERHHIVKTAGEDWQTSEEYHELEHIVTAIKMKAVAIDASLAAAADSITAKIKRLTTSLETKMYRAEKRKAEVEIGRINRLKNSTFPGNSLQERVENVLEYYLDYGSSFFDIIKDGIAPLQNQFLVITEQEM